MVVQYPMLSLLSISWLAMNHVYRSMVTVQKSFNTYDGKLETLGLVEAPCGVL